MILKVSSTWTSTSTWYSVPSYLRIMRRRKKGARSMGEEKKKGKIIIIINKKLTGMVGVNRRLGQGSLVTNI